MRTQRTLKINNIALAFGVGTFFLFYALVGSSEAVQGIILGVLGLTPEQWAQSGWLVSLLLGVIVFLVLQIGLWFWHGMVEK
jgi:hypothetical protein